MLLFMSFTALSPSVRFYFFFLYLQLYFSMLGQLILTLVAFVWAPCLTKFGNLGLPWKSQIRAGCGFFKPQSWAVFFSFSQTITSTLKLNPLFSWYILISGRWSLFMHVFCRLYLDVSAVFSNRVRLRRKRSIWNGCSMRGE